MRNTDIDPTSGSENDLTDREMDEATHNGPGRAGSWAYAGHAEWPDVPYQRNVAAFALVSRDWISHTPRLDHRSGTGGFLLQDLKRLCVTAPPGHGNQEQRPNLPSSARESASSSSRETVASSSKLQHPGQRKIPDYYGGSSDGGSGGGGGDFRGAETGQASSKNNREKPKRQNRDVQRYQKRVRYRRERLRRFMCPIATHCPLVSNGIICNSCCIWNGSDRFSDVKSVYTLITCAV